MTMASTLPEPQIQQSVNPYKARFWDRIAPKYAKSRIGDMAGYDKTIDRTLDLLATGNTVVELGCGTGPRR